MPTIPIDILLRKSEAEASAGEMESALDRVEDSGARSADKVELLEKRFIAAAVAAAGFAAALSIRQLILAGDEYGRLSDRIERATKATGDFLEVRRGLIESSFQTGAALETTVQVFEAINRSRSELNASTDDILSVTNAVQQLATISGASRTATNDALRQLSQGFSSDILRAEEFNSIIENTPEIAARIARGLELSVGQLQRMVREGTVLSADVFESLRSQAEEINLEFEAAPVRIERATAQAASGINQLLASIDEGLGTSSGLSSLLSTLGEASQTLNEVFFAPSAALASAENTPLGRIKSQISDINDDIADLVTNDGILQFGERVRAERLVNLREELRLLQAQKTAIEEKQAAEQAEAAAQAADLETARLIRVEAEKLAEALEEQEKREKALASVTNALSTEEERLALAFERRRELILSNTDAGQERDQLLLDNQAKFNADTEALNQDRIKQLLDDEEEFTQALLEADLLRAQLRKEQMDQLELERRELEIEEALDEAGENPLQTAEEKAEEEHQQRLLEIRTRSAGQFQKLIIDLANFEKLSAKDRTNFILGTLADITQGYIANSETAFKIQRAAALAQATVDGYAAVVGAYKVGASQGGPYLGAAYATFAGLAVGAQISSIANSSFGGGRSNFSAGGLGGGNDIFIPEPLVIEGDSQTEALSQGVTVDLSGATIVTQDAEDFGEFIADASSGALARRFAENDLVVIEPGSAQARALAG